MSHLPLSLINRLNCCFQTLDAVLPKDLFSDYFVLSITLRPRMEIYWQLKYLTCPLLTHPSCGFGTDRSKAAVLVLILWSYVSVACGFYYELMIFSPVEHSDHLAWGKKELVCLCLSRICLFIWAATWQNRQNECAPSEDSDQAGHPPNLISLCCPHEESLGP